MVAELVAGYKDIRAAEQFINSMVENGYITSDEGAELYLMAGGTV